MFFPSVKENHVSNHAQDNQYAHIVHDTVHVVDSIIQAGNVYCSHDTVFHDSVHPENSTLDHSDVREIVASLYLFD